jgi:hypothetical protein
VYAAKFIACFGYETDAAFAVISGIEAFCKPLTDETAQEIPNATAQIMHFSFFIVLFPFVKNIFQHIPERQKYTKVMQLLQQLIL